MLVLSRKLGESILIGDDIRVTVVRIRVNDVRIGIEAPCGIQVDREGWREAHQGPEPPRRAEE
jgi:carbon storage regulator